MILASVNNLFAERFGPDTSRSIFLIGTFLSEVGVAGGILLESKFKTCKDWAAVILVVGGVSAGVFFTLLLFTYDESISSEQQSKIIALETRIAPRDLDDEAQKALGKELSPFAGKKVLVTSYLLDLEAAWVGQKIIQALRLAGIQPISALACEASVGGLTVAIHVTGNDRSLVNALLTSLPKFGLESVADPNPTMWMHCPDEDAPGIDATVFVAIKRPVP